MTVWNQLNLSLPHWVSPLSIDKCRRLSNLKFIISYSNVLLTRFRGGPLVQNVIGSMVKRAQAYLTDRSAGMKMIGFFAHDSTISAFLSHVGGFNRVKPPLASTVIVELYHDADWPVADDDPLSQFHVRLLFRNETDAPPHRLNLSLCTEHQTSSRVGLSVPAGNGGGGECRLHSLEQAMLPHALADLPRECGLSSIIDYWFASSDKLKLSHDSLLINDGEAKSTIAKPKYESDLLVNILFPLLLVEILVLFIYYRVFKK